MQKCKDCQHVKSRRKLNVGQELKCDLANALCEHHELSMREKHKMLGEVVAEFCKVGKINRNEECHYYVRKWWKFWVDDPKAYYVDLSNVNIVLYMRKAWKSL